MANDYIKLYDFYNFDTLNIFCDASITGKYGNQTGCYGVVAVYLDNIVDECYKLVSHTTSNQSELKGLRAAISMANKYKNTYKNINIFCDSQVSILGLRDYIYNWRYNAKDNKLYNTSRVPVANQEIFLECFYMLQDLQFTNLHFYHQAGHIDNTLDKLLRASEVFRRSNNIKCNIDLNIIRFISTYNTYVDMNSRSLLRRSDINKNYIDPIEFECRGPIDKN